MWRFALKNLLTRPARTILAVAGLSIPIFGVLGLFALSGGIRNLLGDTFSRVPGILVVRENVLSPVTSDLPADLGPRLQAIPGVRTVGAELWRLAPTIDGRSLFTRSAGRMLTGGRDFLELTVVAGQDIAAHAEMRGHVFRTHLLPPERGGGRYFTPADRGRPVTVISTKIAGENPRPDGSPKRVGDILRVGRRDLKIVGLYETDSIVLDVTILVDIEVARDLLSVGPDRISCFLVEPETPAVEEALIERIEAEIPEVDARSMAELNLNAGRILRQLDMFLLLIVALALLVGALGIVNTMLMSTAERTLEFGVLRACGWSRRNVLALVSTESLILGCLAGVVGCALAASLTAVANSLLDHGLRLNLAPWLFTLGVGLAALMGVLGGLYPAWKAAQLPPMEAIRRGAAR